MNNTGGLTVFIPVYNEERILAPGVSGLIRFLARARIPFEIIIGSNGSTDRTITIGTGLARRFEEVRFFHLPLRGVGAAFIRGVEMARFSRIVTVDMDLSVSLDFIMQAYDLLDTCDIVVGSKITGRQTRSPVRKIASNCFIALARTMLGIDVHDYSIAAKGYRKEVVETYLDIVDTHTFYVVAILHRASGDQKRIREIPVRCIDTRISRFNLLYEGVYKFGRLFLLWFKTMLRRSEKTG